MKSTLFPLRPLGTRPSSISKSLQLSLGAARHRRRPKHRDDQVTLKLTLISVDSHNANVQYASRTVIDTSTSASLMTYPRANAPIRPIVTPIIGPPRASRAPNSITSPKLRLFPSTASVASDRIRKVALRIVRVNALDQSKMDGGGREAKMLAGSRETSTSQSSKGQALNLENIADERR